MSLVHRLGDDDAKLVAILNISRSMIWRLKNKKIQKIESYIRLLEIHLGTKQAQEPPLERVLDDLRLWSKDSAELRKMLISLHRIVQETA